MIGDFRLSDGLYVPKQFYDDFYYTNPDVDYFERLRADVGLLSRPYVQRASPESFITGDSFVYLCPNPNHLVCVMPISDNTSVFVVNSSFYDTFYENMHEDLYPDAMIQLVANCIYHSSEKVTYLVHLS